MASSSPDSPEGVMYESHVPALRCIHRGKVRDLYAVGDRHLLMVTTDRMSAFDVVLPDPIPGKGRVLTQISQFWFARTGHIVGNQLSGRALAELIPDVAQRQPLEGRALIVRRLQPLPIEAVVRGYLIGSGWKDYQASGQVCGIALPAGLTLAQQLPQPIFTPATKEPLGEHDRNVDFEEVVARIGRPLAQRMRATALALYHFGAEHARRRGILIADTKFEFGLDEQGELLLIDEVMTPDSSRFWPQAQWRIGASPPSFDKQYVRDYLETLDWDKRAPGPHLPEEVVRRTSEKYREALRRLTGPEAGP